MNSKRDRVVHIGKKISKNRAKRMFDEGDVEKEQRGISKTLYYKISKLNKRTSPMENGSRFSRQGHSRLGMRWTHFRLAAGVLRDGKRESNKPMGKNKDEPNG